MLQKLRVGLGVSVNGAAELLACSSSSSSSFSLPMGW